MDQRLTRLLDAFRAIGPVAVAFSGGVDSTLTLWAAINALGEEAVGVHVRSEFICGTERERAERMAAHLGLSMGPGDGERVRVRQVNALANEALRANGPDRCYLCKRVVLGAVRQAAIGKALAEGTNADDDPARPGRRAVAEFGAHSPLAACGMDKATVRELARLVGLPNADDPSNSCLATRVPTGHELTHKRLIAIEGMERAAREMGLADLRARLVPEESAGNNRQGGPDGLDALGGVRLEVRPAQRLLAESCATRLRERAEYIGFAFFTLGERS
jgi:uncharacterized protein